MRDSGTHPSLLREAVTSPAGTTAAALRTLDDRGVRAAVVAAVEAARDRSVVLGG
jgi:pyrroline-5-carboxylate reductase